MFISANALTTTSGDDVGSISVTLVPVMVNYLSGKNHKFEVGAGPVFIFASADFDELGSFSGSGVGGTATFGYRYQPQKAASIFASALPPSSATAAFSPPEGLASDLAFN
jgi:hypothetical protein